MATARAAADERADDLRRAVEGSTPGVVERPRLPFATTDMASEALPTVSKRSRLWAYNSTCQRRRTKIATYVIMMMIVYVDDTNDDVVGDVVGDGVLRKRKLQVNTIPYMPLL
jgi:hypothetical protein